ncbi:hypothetical protein LSUE1_G005133 [Lachnellula suecica]|uniref:Up-regulated during septation protein 1 domain-containing protein n=1 Tax=Lachnellula suecica TaxID=602035 RepID=A0A8T9C3B2_9HELO|nr:hypothetical protein LSUE1_G005133 [Lachnellula suecica]
MSFGYSLGDFVTVGQLAWTVYKSCKEAPESFANISTEVLSLHLVLKEVEELLSEELDLDPHLPASKLASLTTITGGCQDVLRDLEAVTKKYESLSSKSKWTWDRMKWGSNNISELRQRLTSNIVILNAFVRKLNNYMRERQDGKHEGSIISVNTLESLTPDDKFMWREIRKELEYIGISVVAFDANKNFILEWFQRALEEGAFEELEVENDSMYNDSHHASQSLEELYIYESTSILEQRNQMPDSASEMQLPRLNAPVPDGGSSQGPEYERFVKPRGAAEGSVVELPSVYLKSTTYLTPSIHPIAEDKQMFTNHNVDIQTQKPNIVNYDPSIAFNSMAPQYLSGSVLNEKAKMEKRKAFEQLPSGHYPDDASDSISSSEVQILRNQAWVQASRFEVLFSNDVLSLSRELRGLDVRCEYLRKTYRSLRSGRWNLHERIVGYLRSPRTAKFSYESMLKQEEALAELDTSIDDWVTKLELAENRRTRVRQKLLEHVAATLIIPPILIPNS